SLTSPTTIAKLKRWIEKCDTGHPNCFTSDTKRQASPAFVPTRLIELHESSSAIVRLASLTLPVRYVALSYCWGTSQQSTTRTTSLSSREEEIVVSDLSQTLQDAITMTRALGLRYIWIDSVCIVQDDKDDWATEAAKMAEVYSAAWLVLAATGTSDSATGFLFERSSPLVIGSKLLGGKAPVVHARRDEAHHAQERSFEMERCPLFQRAWCMQERELARRVVHFLPDEVVWRCRTETDCECGAPPDHEENQISPLSSFRDLPSPDDSTEHNFAFGRVWVAVVEMYSRLGITNINDTLPALSGLAKYVGTSASGTLVSI
ncbi:HET-domain-containing protein, partial [Pleomassaria siparia CBS 279.74]